MNIFLTIISIFALISGLYLLYNLPSYIIFNIKEECKSNIIQKDKEFEEKEAIHKELKTWLFR